jgi:hypothetical protein
MGPAPYIIKRKQDACSIAMSRKSSDVMQKYDVPNTVCFSAELAVFLFCVAAYGIGRALRRVPAQPLQAWAAPSTGRRGKISFHHYRWPTGMAKPSRMIKNEATTGKKS